MSKRVVNIGSAPNDGTGDSLRDGMDKINQNFTEIYNTFGNGTSLDISNIADATTLDGEDGSYYLDYNNFTNTPSDLSAFNNSVGFVTASVVNGYATETYVTNSLVGYATETYVNSGLTLKANLTGANFTGVVTATQFVGDGSGLTGVSAIGTGVEIEDDGSPVGTAATINFGSNISVAISSGIATVDVQVPQVYLGSNTTGIHTLSNIGIGTTNAESKLTVSGDVKITGVTTVTGNYFYVGNPNVNSSLTSGIILDTSGKITHQSVGGETHIVGYAGSSLSYALSKDGNLYLGGGNPDDGGTGGNISILGETGKIGIGTTNVTDPLTVKGNTSLETLNVSGISTLGGIVINSTNPALSFQTPTDNDIFSISYDTNNDDITFYYKQSGGTGGSQVIWYIPETSSFVLRNPAVDEKLAQFTTGGSVELHHDGSKKFETIGAGATVTGTTFTNQLSVSGVSTFSGTSNFGTTQIISSGEIKLDNLSRIMLGYSGDTPNGLVIRNNSSSNVSEIVNVGGDDIQIQADSGRSVFIGNDDITDNLTVAGYGVTVNGSTLFSKQLSVSGVSTFSGNTRFNGYLGLYGTDNINFFDGSNNVIGSISKNGDITYWTRENYQKHIFQNSFGPPQTLFEIGPVNYSYKDFTVSGITSTKDLIVYGTGNEIGSISSVALMSRTNYLDFGPAIPNTSAPQSFAIRLGSDKATGTFGPYNILQASWTNPSGSVSLNNWNGTEGISISDNGVFAQTKPVIVGTSSSTGTADQKLQVTGGAYVSDSVGIGTTVASSKLTVRGGDISVGVSTAHGVVLTSPNGTQFRLIVDDSGNLSTVAV